MKKPYLVGAPETTTLEESQEALENLFKGLEQESEEFGMGAILAALSLPEQEFALLSGFILEEQEKALNNVEDRLLMVQALNASGAKAEDLVSMFSEIVNKIETEMTGKISQQKIDFLKQFMGILTEAIGSTEGIAKRIVPVAISYCNEGAKRPEYIHAGDVGMDVYSCEEYIIRPGETRIIPLGIKVAIPLGYELQVRPRSGQSVKTKLRIANSPGTIDANYRDEVGIVIENIEPRIVDIETEPIFDSELKINGLKVLSIEYGRDFIIEKGQRIAQLVLSEKPTCVFYEVSDVKTIKGDREGGFGSSGK